jgi:hypothetical protein
MADAGAREIADLLDGKSARLADGAQGLVAGLRKQTGDTEARVPAKARNGLRDVDDYYSHLRREIQKVHTRDTAAKRAVVAALSNLSIGLEEFGKGLKGSTADHTDQLKRGAKIAKRAAADLARARERL